jgi:hypothetical protein
MPGLAPDVATNISNINNGYVAVLTILSEEYKVECGLHIDVDLKYRLCTLMKAMLIHHRSILGQVINAIPSQLTDTWICGFFVKSKLSFWLLGINYLVFRNRRMKVETVVRHLLCSDMRVELYSVYCFTPALLLCLRVP